MGHSIGEFVAAALSGTLAFADALLLVAARGAAMQQLPSGAMLAVRGSRVEIEPYLRDPLRNEAQHEINLASENGPRAIVLAGTHEAIEGLAGRLSAAGITSRKLATSHAFHGRMMEGALTPFADALRAVRFHAPVLPWISTLTGEPVDAKAVTGPDYWLEQLRSPVRFAAAGARAIAEGASLFLEVGPGKTLASLIKQNAPQPEKIVSIASLPSGEAPDEAPAKIETAAARLWEQGVAKSDWAALARGSGSGREMAAAPRTTPDLSLRTKELLGRAAGRGTNDRVASCASCSCAGSRIPSSRALPVIRPLTSPVLPISTTRQYPCRLASLHFWSAA